MFRVARHTAHPTVTDCEDYHAVLAVADQWTQSEDRARLPRLPPLGQPLHLHDQLLREPRHHPTRLRHERGVRAADRSTP